MNKQERPANGSKGQTGRGTIAHTRTREGTMGLDFDNDLEWLPDCEVMVDGSEPTHPLPVLSQGDGWPQLIQEIMDKGRTPAQRDVLLLGAITVLGSTLSPTVRTMYNNGSKWLSPSIMLFVVAQAASGKGVLAQLRHLVQPLHDEVRAKVKREMEEYRIKKLKFEAMGKMRIHAQKEDVPVLPLNRMFIISGNNSGTGMLQNIIDSDGKALLFEPEADTVSTAMNADHGHFNDTLRNSYDHERLSYNRRMEQEYREVKQSYLGVVLSGTPDQVRPLISSAANGLFSRFVYYYMPPVRQWQSQFEVEEDQTAWFVQKGREWMERLKSLRTIQHLTLHLSEEQTQMFDIYMESLFHSSLRSLGEEGVSVVLRLATHLLRIMEVVALLRTIDSGQPFQPDCDVHPENVKDGVCSMFSYFITIDDFTRCLCLGSALMTHSFHILSLLPAVEVAHRGSADKDALFSAMPEVFTRAQYLEKAGEMELGENQVLQWLKRALKKRQVVKIDRATYHFVDC